MRDGARATLPRRALDGAFDLYWGSGVCDDVPALSWFLIAGLVPLALGVTAVASVLLGDYAKAQALAERAAHVLPHGVSDQVIDLILRTRRDSPLLIAISILLMIWTSAGAVGVVERMMSRLLGRERFGTVLGKLRHLLFAAGFVLVIVLMGLAASRTTNLQSRLGLVNPVAQAAFAVASVVATATVCATLYRFSPRDGLPWRAAAVGAAPAGIALWLTPTATAYYLSVVAGRTPVQVFLVLTGILVTCYLAAIAVLVGAAIAIRWAAREHSPAVQPAMAQVDVRRTVP